MASDPTTVEEQNRGVVPHRTLCRMVGAFLALFAGLFTIANGASEPSSNSGAGLTLTNAIQVRRLPVEAAWHPNRVRLSGVVTYQDIEWNMLFVQDTTAGIFLSQSDVKEQFKPGQRVEVEGAADPGAYTPIVSGA